MKSIFLLGLLVPASTILLPNRSSANKAAPNETTSSINGGTKSYNLSAGAHAISANDTTTFSLPIIKQPSSGNSIHSQPAIQSHLQPFHQTSPGIPPSTFIGTFMFPHVKTPNVQPSRSLPTSQTQIVPLKLNSTKLLNDLFGEKNFSTIKNISVPNINNSIIANIFTPSVFNKTNGTLPSLHDILTGQAAGKLDQTEGPTLPPFNMDQPQISPPESGVSIINPLIPPIQISQPNRHVFPGSGKTGSKRKNGSNATVGPLIDPIFKHNGTFAIGAPGPVFPPFSNTTNVNLTVPFNSNISGRHSQPFIPAINNTNQMHILPFFGNETAPNSSESPTKIGQGTVRPQLNINILAGSPLLNILSNITNDCKNSFITLATSMSNQTIGDFKNNFRNWSQVCGKQDIVAELENKTETMQQQFQANVTALMQSLPLYVQGLQSIQKLENVTMGQQRELIMSYMNNISDPNIVKMINLINKLFAQQMITAFLPAASAGSQLAPGPFVGPTLEASKISQSDSSKVAQNNLAIVRPTAMVKPSASEDLQKYLSSKRIQSSVPPSAKSGTVSTTKHATVVKRSIAKRSTEEDYSYSSEELPIEVIDGEFSK